MWTTSIHRHRHFLHNTYDSRAVLQWNKACCDWSLWKHHNFQQQRTSVALGMEEVFKCMPYFPLFMKLKHLVEMMFIAKLHKTDFLSAFEIISSEEYISQFAVMCYYMWHHHSDQCQLQALITDKLIVDMAAAPLYIHGQGFSWKEIPSQALCEYFSSSLTPPLTYPKPWSSIHFQYHQDYLTRSDLILPGLCCSGGFHRCVQDCGQVCYAQGTLTL